MRPGDRFRMEPTIYTSSLTNERVGLMPCTVVAVNARHHHYTVRFDFPLGSFCETFKEEAEQP